MSPNTMDCTGTNTNPAKVYEDGVDQRTVLIEFDSLAQAIAAHDSPGTFPRPLPGLLER
jgi:hypothetical protein